MANVTVTLLGVKKLTDRKSKAGEALEDRACAWFRREYSVSGIDIRKKCVSWVSDEMFEAHKDAFTVDSKGKVQPVGDFPEVQLPQEAIDGMRWEVD